MYAYYIKIHAPMYRSTLVLHRRPRTGELEYGRGTEYAELFKTRREALAAANREERRIDRTWEVHVSRTTLSNRYYWARA